MKRFELWLSIFCSMAASVSIAATGSSPEFKLDLRGLGPWQRHTAAAVDENSFVSVLRHKTGNSSFDLPTEAQWEYACRVKTTTSLNTGKNLSDNDQDSEMNDAGRYYYNSGMDDTVKTSVGGLDWTKMRSRFGNSDVAEATSLVGLYSANGYGLYDMHGNALEWCLDRALLSRDNNVCDPVGPSEEKGYRVVRGGSWVAPASECTAGYYYGGSLHGGVQSTYASGTLGFRLCLQGGDIPDLASATTLVNESGAGSQSWTPTRSGAYYLTHSTMNGTTNVQLASAWFEVPGCTLALEPQGELTNGVMIAINGADEGWTVYYTTNGLAPSKASEPYVGPFSLPESGTVRAVAYNEQGVTSEEVTTTFTLHDALSVVGAVARQRYPWNGMVDVDLELEGDEKLKYEVEVEARDLEGGTNLPVKTIVVVRTVPSAPQSQGNEDSLVGDCGGQGLPALPPGEYRLTWNADADIAADGEFPRVAVTVKATRQSAIAAYARALTISTDGYASDETLTNVPVLVRLSTAIDGFDYRDFACPSNGADMAFFDADENELPYEIDEWHTNGESLVRVKLPTMRRDTRITCAYGRKLGMKNDELRIADRHLVWKEYAGVWHMNEDSGTAYDSTSHGLDALPSCGTNGNASLMVAFANGACGCARSNGVLGNQMEIPSYDGLRLGGFFSASGWYRADSVTGYSKMFYRNLLWSDGGWGMEFKNGSTHEINVVGGNNDVFLNRVQIPDVKNSWVNITLVYKGTVVSCFTNGACAATGAITPATDNGMSLIVGGDVMRYDEIRLRGGSLSAARIKADYDMIADREFCTYGAVKKGA